MSNIRYKGGERFFSKETFLRQCHLTCLLDVDKRLVSNFQENSFCHYHLACLVDVDTRAAFLSPHHLLVWWQEHVPAEDVGGDDVLLEFNAFRNSHLAHIDQIRILAWHLNSRNLSCFFTWKRWQWLRPSPSLAPSCWATSLPGFFCC